MSGSSPLVSIVIPVYNGMPYIIDAIDSALNQTYSPLEIEVIENHSSDGTAEWLRTCTDARIRVVYRDETQPAGANWNEAIAQTRGDFVKLMCADDLITPDTIALQVAALRANPGAVMVAARRRVIGADGRVLKATHGLGPLRDVLDGAAALKACCIAGTNLLGEPAAVLFDGDAIRSAMPWKDELPYMIDLNTYAKVLSHGSVVCQEQVLASFRVSTTSWSSSLLAQQADQVRQWRESVVSSGQVSLSGIERIRSDVNLRLRAWGRRAYFMRAARQARRAATPTATA